MNTAQNIEVIQIEDEITEACLQSGLSDQSQAQKKKSFTLRLKELEELEKRIELDIA